MPTQLQFKNGILHSNQLEDADLKQARSTQSKSITQLPLKKAWSGIRVDRDSSFTRSLVAPLGCHQPLSPVKSQVKRLPPGKCPPTDLSPHGCHPSLYGDGGSEVPWPFWPKQLQSFSVLVFLFSFAVFSLTLLPSWVLKKISPKFFFTQIFFHPKVFFNELRVKQGSTQCCQAF